MKPPRRRRPAPTRMKLTGLALAAALAATLLAGCSGEPGAESTQTTAVPPSQPDAPSPRSAATPSPSHGTSSAAPSDESLVGTVVRFTAGTARVDVTIGEDSPATRDFVSMLPMTLELEEFNGREKIAYPPRELEWEGSPGSDPQDGDLIYFVPWGNIGFYYNTSGIGYSDQTLHLGTYDATEDELSRFEGQQTTVEVVD